MHKQKENTYIFPQGHTVLDFYCMRQLQRQFLPTQYQLEIGREENQKLWLR